MSRFKHLLSVFDRGFFRKGPVTDSRLSRLRRVLAYACALFSSQGKQAEIDRPISKRSHSALPAFCRVDGRWPFVGAGELHDRGCAKMVGSSHRAFLRRGVLRWRLVPFSRLHFIGRSVFLQHPLPLRNHPSKINHSPCLIPMTSLRLRSTSFRMISPTTGASKCIPCACYSAAHTLYRNRVLICFGSFSMGSETQSIASSVNEYLEQNGKSFYSTLPGTRVTDDIRTQISLVLRAGQEPHAGG